MISDSRPAPDATLLRYGLRRLLYALPFDLMAMGFGVAGIWLVVRVGHLPVRGWLCVGLMVGMGLLGVLQFVLRWRGRRWVTVFDATGLWWIRGDQAAVIRWDSLAGVGIYWARGGRTGKFSVELCPGQEIDRDDPLLWRFVRDADPLRPGLPRLRYRIDVGDSHQAYEKALRRWAPPGLWFGRKEQPVSYAGAPDHAGHRERTAEGTGAPTRHALVFEPAVIGDEVLVFRSTVAIRRRLGAASVMALLCAWAVLSLRPGRLDGTGALVRLLTAGALTLFTVWALALVVRGVRRIWGRLIVMDRVGVHVTQGGQAAAVPWDSLAGVGIHAAPPLHTLELCPKEGIDRDDPLLWPFVRDDEPLRPGLPRLRHRIPLGLGTSRHEVAEACRRWAPDLWFGGRRMPNGYEGKPDREGHRQRIRARGGRWDGPGPNHQPRTNRTNRTNR
ncbi:hypothetical protein [Streptomyces sp. NPDC057616]|uniref:hypothetical protein n=1 Tax=Streptomyces sp. NPDC057616 TaxID=3346183 RepID=UPI00368F85A9